MAPQIWGQKGSKFHKLLLRNSLCYVMGANISILQLLTIHSIFFLMRYVIGFLKGLEVQNFHY